MLTYIGNVSTQVGIIISELTRLFTYLDSYPFAYYILCLAIVLTVVTSLKQLIRMD